MRLSSLLLCTCLSSLAFPAYAQDAPPRPTLKPRVEGNIRAGTERTIAMTEIWVPLAQDSDSVIYGDGRIMGDDDDNKEFNLGVGYRKIVTDVPVLGKGVAGANVWIDRRLTESGSTFHQITTGAEWHGETYDIKANAYIPLNKEETHNLGSMASTPYLAGSGIFYDLTNRKLVEEAQPGLDLELGLNVSGIVDGFADSARVYAGAYHFEGDKSDSVTGWRTRVAADITPDVQLGARFQRDDQRGSQGFLEATIRFPFGNKQSYRQHGLYARLDESPERDIDIVTGAVTGVPAGDTVQTAVPVLNAASGDPQRVLYVDNSAAGGGTGTIDSPFNTLAAAQAALDDNDVVYVAHGDGLTTNMANGFTINRSGVSFIGEGSAFVYDGGKFTTGNADFSGLTLKAAGLAPTITNGAGDGILISADNALVSGFITSNTSGFGVAALANGASWNNLNISNITTNNAGRYGLIVQTGDSTQAGGPNGHIKNVYINNVTTNQSATHGIGIWASSNGIIDNVYMNNIRSEQSGSRGVWVHTNSLGMIHNVDINDVVVRNSGTVGLYLWSDRGNVGNFNVRNVLSEGNAEQGVYVRMSSNLATGQVTMNNATLNNIITRGNTLDGLYVHATAFSTITNTTLNGVNAYNNARHGIYIQGVDTGAVTASVQNSITTGNAQHGIAVYDDTSGTFEVDLGGGGRSAGRNVLAANTLEDLALDYDGRTLSVMNNWWGQASGPDQDAPNIGIRPQIYYGAPMNEGLVGHWTFDNEWMGTTTAYDRSGNNNHGTLAGGITSANLINDQRRQSLSFDGVGFVTVPDANSLDLPNTLTLVANLMPDYTVPGYASHPISKWSGGTADANFSLYHFGDTGGGSYPSDYRMFATGSASGWQAIGRAYDAPSPVWHQYGFTYNSATTSQVYVDGATHSTSQPNNGTLTTNNHALRIGSLFAGDIDDVRIYNRVLTAAQMAELYRMDTTSVVNFGGFMTSAP